VEKRLFWGAIIVIFLYAMLPWILTRMLHIASYYRGKPSAAPKIGLTFDDGPDPVYTPMLLDLLKLYGVKATFFVVGSRAERFPDLIERMRREGHEIGIHNYRHQSNWLLWPWTVRSQVERTASVIERLTGERPTLYRPPWGIVNIFDLWLLRRYRIVLWSVMSGDWTCSGPGDARRLADRILRKMSDGAIVLLHDCGETFGARRDAPRYMLEALKTVLDHCRDKNYDYVTVGEMMRMDEANGARSANWARKIIVTLWLKWERLFARWFRIRPVDQENTFLKLRIRKYSGTSPIPLEDGEVIQRGDLIAELHLDNELLLQLGTNSRSMVHLTVQLIRRMEELMPKLSELLRSPEYSEVKGLYGVSLIHRGTRRFGFTTVELPKGVFAFFTKWYLRLLMYVIHPEGKERIETKTELLVPKIIAISRKELLNRYCH